MTTQPAGRRSASSPLRRAAVHTLIAGAVLAIAAALGPLWVVRAGIVLALVAGVLAVRFAWRESRQERHQHGQQLLSQVRAHNDQLSSERQRNLEIVDVLRRASEDSDEEVVQLQVRIGKLRTELSSLRGDNAALRADVLDRDRRISRLVTDLAAREEELRRLRDASQDAEVYAMPRYAEKAEKAEKADWDALPTAEDLWSEGNYPTVVDLQKLAFPNEPVDRARRQA